MIFLARLFLIVMAVMFFPIYAAWIGIGWIMDRRGQRALAVLKGRRWIARKCLNN